MTTNKPEVVSIYNTATGESEEVVRLSDYEALQARLDELQEDCYILMEERDHSERNSSAFENRMGDLQVENGKLRDKYKALQAECEKLRKDADQYRRLIELGEDFQWENIIRVDISGFPSRADAINAAMQGDQP